MKDLENLGDSWGILTETPSNSQLAFAINDLNEAVRELQDTLADVRIANSAKLNGILDLYDDLKEKITGWEEELAKPLDYERAYRSFLPKEEPRYTIAELREKASSFAKTTPYGSFDATYHEFFKWLEKEEA